MKLTVGIKALNEEKHIAASLASAVAAARPFDGDVILADSGSADQTITIAREFPVRIVQLANSTERSCGAGAQLAFQYSRGDYFYFLDGDMVLDRDFLPNGIAYLEAHPDVAAVGGHVRERNVTCQEFKIRVNTLHEDPDRTPGIVSRLEGGGLYRAAAVREAGYFSDRNLHGFEEFELAARLQSHGWKLARIDHVAVDHYGHTLGGYRLLLRRVRSGYARGSGEVLRAALGKKHLSIVLRQLSHIRHGAVVIAWWLLLIATFQISVYLPALLLLAAISFLSFRRGSLGLGIYSLTSWNVSALGLVLGLLYRRVAPEIPLSSVELYDRGRQCTDAGPEQTASSTYDSSHPPSIENANQ